MTDSVPAELAERRIIAAALKTLRARANLTQPDVAHVLGLSAQAYQKYEAGERRFTAERLEQILGALRSTPEDLELERARILGREAPARASGGHSPSLSPSPARREARSLEAPILGGVRMGQNGPEIYDAGEPVGAWDLGQYFGPDTGAVQGAGDSMGDWLQPGEMALFNRNRYPVPGGGCVAELKTGQILIKLYVRTDGSNLFLEQLNPREVITVPLREVKGVYGVTLRGGRR